MNASFSVMSLWPHAILVGFFAIVSLRVRSRAVPFCLALALSVIAVWGYWHLDNGVAPPRVSGSTGQLVALGIASLVPLLVTVVTGHALQEKRVKAFVQVTGSALAGLLTGFFMPGLQMFLGCSFTGLCP